MPLLQVLYGKHAAALYAQAADFNKTSRFYYMKAEDAYYLANAQASFDDWRRSRKQVNFLCFVIPRVFAIFRSCPYFALWSLHSL
jgi:hypothetical protein